MILKGIIYDGNSLEAHSGELEVHEQNITLKWGDLFHKTYNRTEMRLEDRLGSVSQVITFIDGLRFETEEFDALQRAFPNASRNNFVYKLEKNWPLVSFLVLLMLTLSIGFYFFGLPKLAAYSAQHLPRSVDEKIQDGVENLFEKMRIKQESKLEKNELSELNQIFNEINDKYDGKYKIDVISGENKIGANALALPFNQIYITDELIDLAKNNEEIKLIIWHEIGHIHYRHGLQMLISKSALSFLMVSIFGTTDYASFPLAVLNNSYSRDHEKEADLFAAKIAMENGIDPVQMGYLLERLGSERKNSKSKRSKDDKFLEMISTHPLTPDRIEYLTEFKNTYATGGNEKTNPSNP